MFELFSDIYFVVYKLYYVGQNDNLGTHVSLKNWDRGSSKNHMTISSLISIDESNKASLLIHVFLNVVHAFRSG
jgi:hypothetical protein